MGVTHTPKFTILLVLDGGALFCDLQLLHKKMCDEVILYTLNVLKPIMHSYAGLTNDGLTHLNTFKNVPSG